MLSSDNRYVPWLLTVLSLAGYVLVPFYFPLLDQYNRAPLRDIRYFAPSALGGLGYGALFLMLYAAYLASARRFAKAKANIALILGMVVVFSLPLLFAYPINATDVFRYFIRGRVTGYYGYSALTVPPDAFIHDPYLPLAGEWAGQTSPYGPLWEIVAAAITIVSGQNLLITLLLFKLLAVLAHGAIGFMVWEAFSAHRARRRVSLTILWSWNPALLFMFAVDGHNDALMLFWLALGYVVMRRRPLTGFLIAALGALTKPVAVLALPFLLIGCLRQEESWRQRLRFLVTAGVGSGLMALIAFVPFGSPLHLVVRLLTEASEAVGFSPGILIILLAQRLNLPIDLAVVIEVGTAIGLFSLALLALWLMWRVWRGMRPVQGIVTVFAAYLVTALTFRIWYSMWPFVWLVFDGLRSRFALTTGIWFLCTAHLSVLIYGHLRVHALQGDQVITHLIGVPFTFLLPLILAWRFPLAPGVDGS